MSHKNAIKPPQVGDIIYIPSKAYCKHGIGDEIGIPAEVTAVTDRMIQGETVTFVATTKSPFQHYDWSDLGPEQEMLERTFNEHEARSGTNNKPFQQCA